MKKLFVLLALLVACTISQAQVITHPYPYEETGQMLNLSNTHALQTNDTAVGTTIYFTTSVWNASNLPTANAVPGKGVIKYNVSTLHASTTSTTNPTVVFTPQRSFNGSTGWTNIPGVTAATVTPTSATTESTAGFDILYNPGPYTRMKCVVTGDTASIKVFYDFYKDFNYTNR